MNLTSKQYGFINDVFLGYTKQEAYKRNYNAENMSYHAIANEAYELMQNPEISLKLEELQGKIEAVSVSSEENRRKVLNRIINTEIKDCDIYPSHVLQAIKINNDMDNIGGSTSFTINIDKAVIDARDRLNSLLSGRTNLQLGQSDGYISTTEPENGGSQDMPHPDNSGVNQD